MRRRRCTTCQWLYGVERKTGREEERRTGDVEPDRGVGEHAVLRHEPDRRPEAPLAHVTHVGPVDAHGALGRVVHAEQEARQGALARAGRADERDRLPGGHVERDALEHVYLAVVREMDVAEGDAGALGPDDELDRVLLVRDLALLLEELDELLRVDGVAHDATVLRAARRAVNRGSGRREGEVEAGGWRRRRADSRGSRSG